MKKIKIIGIDPGTAIVGYGIIETPFNKTSFKEMKMKKVGFISTPKDYTFEKRLYILEKKFLKLLRETEPQIAIVENLFFFKNKKTAIKVAEATGVIRLSLKKRKIKIMDISPLEVKKILLKNGKANKNEIQKRVKEILKLKEKISPDDASDALAIAIAGVKKYGPFS